MEFFRGKKLPRSFSRNSAVSTKQQQLHSSSRASFVSLYGSLGQQPPRHRDRSDRSIETASQWLTGEILVEICCISGMKGWNPSQLCRDYNKPLYGWNPTQLITIYYAPGLVVISAPWKTSASQSTFSPQSSLMGWNHGNPGTAGRRRGPIDRRNGCHGAWNHLCSMVNSIDCVLAERYGGVGWFVVKVTDQKWGFSWP